MSEEKKNQNTFENKVEAAAHAAQTHADEYSLSDDRRVKTLSPGRLVAKRFFRNRVAVFGLVVLTLMFIFSYIGGLVSPYKQDQIFYRYDSAQKRYAAVTENKDLRYVIEDGFDFSSIAKAKFVLATKGTNPEFDVNGDIYSYTKEGENFYSIYKDGNLIAIASFDIVSSSKSNEQVPLRLQYNLLKSVHDKKAEFELDGNKYSVSEDGTLTLGSEEIAYASKYSIQPATSDVFLSKDFKDQLLEAIETSDTDFAFKGTDGVDAEYKITFNPDKQEWSVMQYVDTKVFDTYSGPSKEHWLGTDRNGMDMLTRLMYGGRVSLYIGFVVVIMSTIIGVILGGMSGFFGGWVDMLIMRLVDIFYCIPSLPIIIILGSIMDAMRVDPQVRMFYLMLILGILGWAGTARMVRGQILSFREQEFMVAAEATGIRASRRIFRHLIPNVMPQLIVSMTMGLGSTIITEATLSFLGLGVKFPFASWGNIINDVNDTYVLTNYWFIWIPAGILLLATVLAFNLVGDGLRDAFDPRMNR